MRSLHARNFPRRDDESSITPTPTGYTPTGQFPTPTPSGGVGSSTVERSIGVGYGSPDGPDEPIVWKLAKSGQLSWREPGGEWQTDSERSFRIAPIVVAVDEDERVAIALDDDGAVVYSLYQGGAWDFENGWVSLGLTAWNRPSAVSTAEGTLDVFVIDTEGLLHHANLNQGEWGEWEQVGSDLAGEVAVAFWGSNFDIFATAGETIKHRSFTTAGGWAADWEDVGHPRPDGSAFSSPMAVSFEGEKDNGEPGQQTDVVVVVESLGSQHKLLDANGEWGEWTFLPASHEGYEFAHTQALVLGAPGGAPAHIVSRGTDNCIHYTSFNGTKWDFWTFLWCNPFTPGGPTWPTRSLPITAAISGNERIALVAQNVTGEVLYLDLELPVDREASHPNEVWEDLGIIRGVIGG